MKKDVVFILTAALVLMISVISFCQADKTIIQGKKLIEESYSKFDPAGMISAKGYFDRVLSTEPDNISAQYHSAYADYRIATYYWKNKNTKEFNNYINLAEERLNKIIQIDPKNNESKALLITIYGVKISNDWSLAPTLGTECGKLSGELMEAAPSNPRVLLQVGINKYNTPEFFGGSKTGAQKLFSSAISLFEKEDKLNTVEASWGYTDALAWLGISYVEHKEFEKAAEAYKKALSINPDYGWINHQLMPALQKALDEK